MKGGWKIFWIVCGIAFISGLILYGAGRMMGATWDDVDDDLVIHAFNGGTFSSDSDYDYGESADVPDSVEEYPGVTEIDVDVTGISLQLLPSEDGAFRVETKDMDSRLEYRCRQNGKKLEIETTDSLRVINRIKNNAATVWVYLPEGQLEKIDISNQAGEVYAESVNAEKFLLDVGAGEAKLTGFNVQKADFSCGVGEITGTGMVLDKADLSCGVGEIDLTLEGKRTDYSCEVSCGIGDVNVGGRHFSGIGMDQSDGEHDGEHDGDRKLCIDCGVGSVSVEFAEE